MRLWLQDYATDRRLTGFDRAAKAAIGRVILAESPLLRQLAFAESHELGNVTHSPPR